MRWRLLIVLDTTVLIDIRRGRMNVKKLLDKYENEVYGISAITIYELYAGLGYTHQKLGQELYETHKEKLESLLTDYEIFDINRLILEESGLIEGELMAKGITIDLQDIIIGITAEHVKAEKIITRNPDHFKYFKVPIESYEIE